MENHFIPEIKASTERLQTSLERMNQIETETKKLNLELQEELKSRRKHQV